MCKMESKRFYFKNKPQFPVACNLQASEVLLDKTGEHLWLQTRAQVVPAPQVWNPQLVKIAVPKSTDKQTGFVQKVIIIQ